MATARADLKRAAVAAVRGLRARRAQGLRRDLVATLSSDRARALLGASGQGAAIIYLGCRLRASRNPPRSSGHVLALAAHTSRASRGLAASVSWALIAPASAWQVCADRRLCWRASSSTTGARGCPHSAATAARCCPTSATAIEWAGLALGVKRLALQRDRALAVPEGLAIFVLTAGVLLCAALVETVAVPHRCDAAFREIDAPMRSAQRRSTSLRADPRRLPTEIASRVLCTGALA